MRRAATRRGFTIGLPGLLLALGLMAACAEKETASSPAAPKKSVEPGELAEAPKTALGDLPAKRDASAPFDLSGVIRRVHFAYRAEGEGFSGGHGTYAVEVSGGVVRLRPFHHPEALHPTPGDEPEAMAHRFEPPEIGKVIEGAAFELETRSIARGEARRPRPVVQSEIDDADGSLTLGRGAVVERLRNGEEGVEQSWAFAQKPEGEGDLVVRVRVAGLRYVGETGKGLHFQDPKSGLGFRYGLATWVDAEGKRQELGAARYADGELAVRVPAEVVERTKYPAVLDPLIGPEFGMDEPVTSLSMAGQDSPAMAWDGTNYLVVWRDYRGGVSTDIYGARVSSAGAVLDPSGIAISVAANQQDAPAVAWNGTNYLVVWQDYRRNVLDIYGARVSGAGEVLDDSGIVISAATGNKYAPAVAWDGTNHLVVWRDNRNANGYDIYGARVSINGAVLDASGVAISTAASYQFSPAVACDGTHCLVVWEDYRSGAGSDVYGARVSGAGTVLDLSYPLI